MNEPNRDIYEDIAKNERWLSNFSTPAPRAEVLKRIKLAMREELQAGHGNQKRWSVGYGVLAAAATIVLSITVGWYSVKMQQPSNTKLSNTAAMVQNDVSLPVPPSTNETLSDLEDWTTSDDDASLDGTSLYDAMESALAEGADVGSTQG